MHRISLKHTHQDGMPCTAIEDIAALAKNPNGWMDGFDKARCREFAGTEEEAAALRDEIERNCSGELALWKAYQ